MNKLAQLTTKLPEGLSTKTGRAGLQLSKNSPHLMFGAGIVGVVATAVLASKATLRLESTLQGIQDTKDVIENSVGTKLSDGEVVTEAQKQRMMVLVSVKGAGKIAKLYAPTIAVGTVSIAILTGSHVVLNRRNVALTAAYAGLEKAYQEYRDRVMAELGEDRERELRYPTEEKTVKVDGKNKKVVVPDGTPSLYARFFDEYNKNWCKTPEYNRMFLNTQQNWANELLRARGHVFLNEVYDMLGLERSKAGAVVGWVNDGSGDGFIDFGLFEDRERARAFVNGLEPSILLDFNVDGVIYDKI